VKLLICGIDILVAWYGLHLSIVNLILYHLERISILKSKGFAYCNCHCVLTTVILDKYYLI